MISSFEITSSHKPDDIGEPGQRTRTKQKTREALADASLVLFAQYGYDDVSVTQIARRAGVSERTFFHYFPTKADVLFDVSPDDLDRLQGYVRDQPRSMGYVDAVECALLTWGTWRGDHPSHHQRTQLLFRAAESSATLRGRELDYNTAFANAIANGLAQREGFLAPDLDMMTAGAICMMVMHRVVGQWTKAASCDLPALIKTNFDAMRRVV
jgi:TetR/AcrR family transcriptional regulator, regulator of mycofactocin system